MRYKGKSVEIIGSKTLTLSSCHPILGDTKMRNIVIKPMLLNPMVETCLDYFESCCAFLLFAAQYGRYALFSPYLAIALYNPLVCCYFFKGHGASCMQFLCGDANFGTKSELCSISE